MTHVSTSQTSPFARVAFVTRAQGGPLDHASTNLVSLALRFSIAAVFIIGGWWKLSRALDPARAGDLVDKYLASNGYINGFFQDYLFTNGILTPWSFLTALSAFELFAGLALVAGVLVRPLALILGFLMWSFVAALPVVTTPGFLSDGPTYLTPALLVQIRDVGLSGFCFALAVVGSGRYSLDARLFGRGGAGSGADWDDLGLLIRLSVAAAFIVGGFFYGLDHIKSWTSVPFPLVAVGLVLASGHAVRVAALAACVILAVYCMDKLDTAKSVWDNLNAIKREFAYLGASGVLIWKTGGRRFQVAAVFRAPRATLFGAPANVTRPQEEGNLVSGL